MRASWGQNFALYLRRNVLTTERLLEAAWMEGVGNFVYASSSSVYGPDKGGPVPEEAVRKPASPYGVSKLVAEELVGLYARERGVPATVLRYFSVYGPRQRPEMALARFISAAVEGRSVEIFGDGGQAREMTYVSDVVEATVAALEQGRRATLRTYNVGGGTRTTVNGMLDAVQRATGERVEAVDGVDHDGHLGEARRQPSVDPGFGIVGVDDVGTEPAEERTQLGQRQEVPVRGAGPGGVAKADVADAR